MPVDSCCVFKSRFFFCTKIIGITLHIPNVSHRCFCVAHLCSLSDSVFIWRHCGHVGGVNKETAAILEEWNILLRIELYFYANPSFCFIMQIWLLVTWANTLYNRFLTVQEMCVRTCPFVLGANTHVDFLHFTRRCNFSNLFVTQCLSKYSWLPSRQSTRLKCSALP